MSSTRGAPSSKGHASPRRSDERRVERPDQRVGTRGAGVAAAAGVARFSAARSRRTRARDPPRPPPPKATPSASRERPWAAQKQDSDHLAPCAVLWRFSGDERAPKSRPRVHGHARRDAGVGGVPLGVRSRRHAPKPIGRETNRSRCGSVGWRRTAKVARCPFVRLSPRSRLSPPQSCCSGALPPPSARCPRRPRPALASASETRASTRPASSAHAWRKTTARAEAALPVSRSTEATDAPRDAARRKHLPSRRITLSIARSGC